MGNQADRAWSYSNPVQVVFGENAFASLTDKIAGRPYCLVTYSDAAIFAQLEESLAKTAGPAAVVIRNVEPNPSYPALDAACRLFGEAPVSPAVIVALASRAGRYWRMLSRSWSRALLLGMRESCRKIWVTCSLVKSTPPGYQLFGTLQKTCGCSFSSWSGMPAARSSTRRLWIVAGWTPIWRARSACFHVRVSRKAFKIATMVSVLLRCPTGGEGIPVGT